MSPPPYTTIPLHQRHTAYCIHWFGLFVSKTMSTPPYTTIPLHPLCTAYCIHWFDLFAPKTMSSPPYTTIQLHPLHTASTGLTFLHQRQCPHHHILLFYCVHCVLSTAFTASTGLTFCIKDNVPTTIYHYSTASTAYCVHCVLHPLHPLHPLV